MSIHTPPAVKRIGTYSALTKARARDASWRDAVGAFHLGLSDGTAFGVKGAGRVALDAVHCLSTHSRGASNVD